MPGAAITVPVDVYRHQPGVDSAPRFQHYSVEVAPHTPVLSVLLKLRAETDPTLSLRYSCRSAICGSCAMRINSKSRLACETPVGPEVERHGRVVVEPMANQPVVRDLVVDQGPFWRRYDQIEPHLKVDPKHPMPQGRPNPMTPVQVERFHDTPRCIACAACYSACPAVAADPEFPGPMALAKLYRFVVDPRDAATQDRLVRIQTEGLWLCLRCHLCTEACPKDVRPSERIRDLKELAIAAQGVTERGSRHAVAFKENLLDRGTLSEAKLARQTFGLAGMVGQLPHSLAILRKKPEVARKPPAIEGKEELERIYAALDKESGP